jgi:hypothetical protein
VFLNAFLLAILVCYECDAVVSRQNRSWRIESDQPSVVENGNLVERIDSLELRMVAYVSHDDLHTRTWNLLGVL